MVAAASVTLTATVCLSASDGAYVRDVQEWRARHESSYRKEYVSLAGLFFLKAGANTAGSAASNDIVLPKTLPAVVGRFVLDGDRVRFEPRSGAIAHLNRQPVSGPVILKDDEEAESPDELTVGRVALWVHRSGERRTIRMRDEQSGQARSFAGFRWFPIDERYRVVGRFVRDAAPHDVHTPNLMGDDVLFKTEGVVEFALDGQTVRLRPVTAEAGRLWFIFRDGTSGRETYATARFLYADLRDDGTTLLDFNEAYNPPCAFNPYTTCPLPLPENRLTLRILAGEKDYPHHQ